MYDTQEKLFCYYKLVYAAFLNYALINYFSQIKKVINKRVIWITYVNIYHYTWEFDLNTTNLLNILFFNKMDFFLLSRFWAENVLECDVW